MIWLDIWLSFQQRKIIIFRPLITGIEQGTSPTSSINCSGRFRSSSKWGICHPHPKTTEGPPPPPPPPSKIIFVSLPCRLKFGLKIKGGPAPPPLGPSPKLTNVLYPKSSKKTMQVLHIINSQPIIITLLLQYFLVFCH